MDLEGPVLSILPVAVAAAHEPSDEAASVIGAGPVLLADGRLGHLAAIKLLLHVASDEDKVGVEALPAAEAARQARLPDKWPGRGHAGASPVGVAATCRISLRNAERDAGTGFGLWDNPYHVVKQPGGRADVLAQQGRFALVRSKVSD